MAGSCAHNSFKVLGGLGWKSIKTYFTIKAVTLVMILPVDCMRELGNLQSVSLSVTDPPAFSKCVQIPDYCPIWLHVLISCDAVIISTQPSDIVPICAGQYNFWYKERETELVDGKWGWLFTNNNQLRMKCPVSWGQRFLLLPPRLLPSKRTVSPKSVVSCTSLEFIVIVKPSAGLRGGDTRSPFT